MSRKVQKNIKANCHTCICAETRLVISTGVKVYIYIYIYMFALKWMGHECHASGIIITIMTGVIYCISNILDLEDQTKL